MVRTNSLTSAMARWDLFKLDWHICIRLVSVGRVDFIDLFAMKCMDLSLLEVENVLVSSYLVQIVPP